MVLNAEQTKQKDQYVRKRAVIKTRITAAKTFLSTQEENPDIHAIRANMDRLEKAFSPLGEYTEALKELEPAVDHYAEQKTMERDYTDLLTTAYRLKDKVAQPSSSSSVNSGNSSVDSGTAPRASPNPFASQPTLARLPEQALPKFDGKYEDWLGFQDDFQSTIGRRQGLSDTDKLKYLRSCLSGEPQRLVKQFETTDAGYRSAWLLLKKTFEDKGRIRERHVTEIFNIPALQRESATELCELINTVELHCSSLKSLSEDNFGTIMLCIVLSKIDKNTRKQWRMSLKEGELPTYDELISFLRRMVISPDEPIITFKNEKHGGHGKGRENAGNNNLKSSKQTRSFVTTTASECPVCKENHPLFQCSDFKKLSPKDRHQAATRASLCINCLRPGHRVKQCTSAFTCKTCHNRHHTSLHFPDPSRSATEASESAPVKASQS